MATVDTTFTTPIEFMIDVPAPASTLEGFTEWTYSDSFPKQGRITFIDGRLLIDMSPERYESHLKIKEVVSRVLGGIVAAESLGEFYPDGARVKHTLTAISNEPDAMFATWDTLKSGRLSLPPGRDPELYVELIGTPDWICEVVSDSSEEKDTQLLRAKYFAVGIPEYWLIDARGPAIDFQVLVPGANGYQPAKLDQAWQWSPTFSRWFELTREENELGRWTYELKSKA